MYTNRQVVETHQANEAGPAQTPPAAPNISRLLREGRGSGWWLHWFQEAWLGCPSGHFSPWTNSWTKV